MGKMKEIFTNRCHEIADEKYSKDFCFLTKEQQDEICKLAENALQDYQAFHIDSMKNKEKENA